jgi:ferric-dicitrate binding protein FerR (iron transport regulator)
MGRFLIDDASCARARSWVSHELDSELSQLERLFLAAHIRRCPECARFAEDVRAFTRVVRATPLEAPTRSFAIPERRPTRTRVMARLALATALVALAGVLGVLAGSNGDGPADQATAPVGDVAFVVQESFERERARRVEVEEPRERIRPPGRLGGHV